MATKGNKGLSRTCCISGTAGPSRELSYLIQYLPLCLAVSYPFGSEVKNLPVMLETRVWSLGQQDSLDQEGNGCPLQYSCLENSMNRGAWQGYISPRGCKELDTTDWLTLLLFTFTAQTQVRQHFSGKMGYEVGVFSTTPCSLKKQGGPGLHRAQTWNHTKTEEAAFCARHSSSPPVALPHGIGAQTLGDRVACFHLN